MEKSLNSFGDGVMANFDDVNDAINCSININKEFSELGLPEPILSKTGIHWGPVSFFNTLNQKFLDPQGTTVDIAAKNCWNCKRSASIDIEKSI